MLILLIGIATAFNLIILKMKFEDDRYGDMSLDLLTLILLTTFFGGTITGMAVAVVAGGIISLYLFFFPPEIF